LSQWSHWNGRSVEWLLTCNSKLSSFVKLFPHWGQGWPCLPIFKCWTSLTLLGKFISQVMTGHLLGWPKNTTKKHIKKKWKLRVFWGVVYSIFFSNFLTLGGTFLLIKKFLELFGMNFFFKFFFSNFFFFEFFLGGTFCN
jgi:hypothetical protein